MTQSIHIHFHLLYCRRLYSRPRMRRNMKIVLAIAFMINVVFFLRCKCAGCVRVFLIRPVSTLTSFCCLITPLSGTRKSHCQRYALLCVEVLKWWVTTQQLYMYGHSTSWLVNKRTCFYGDINYVQLVSRVCFKKTTYLTCRYWNSSVIWFACIIYVANCTFWFRVDER